MWRIKQLLTMQFAAGGSNGRSGGSWASRRAPCTSIRAGRQRRGSAWPLAPDVTDESLVARLFANAVVRAGARFHVEPDWPALVRELTRPGDCPKSGGITRRLRHLHLDGRWVRTVDRSRNQASRCKLRSGLAAEGQHLAETSASAAPCSSGD